MKKALALVLSGVLALSLVACSAGQTNEKDNTAASSVNKSDQTVTATSPYGEYHWNLAMTVSESTTNYKMAKYFADLVREKTDGMMTFMRAFRITRKICWMTVLRRQQRMRSRLQQTPSNRIRRRLKVPDVRSFSSVMMTSLFSETKRRWYTIW